MTRTMALAASVLVLGGIACKPSAPAEATGPTGRRDDRVTHEEASETVDLPKSAGVFVLSESDPPRRFGEENLWEHVDGAEHEYLRLGFRSLLVAYYALREGRGEVTVEIFRMKTPEAARVAFDEAALAEGRAGSLCGRSQSKGNFLLFQRQDRTVKLTADFYDPSTQARLEELAEAVCEAIGAR